jgi:uncharacterized FAD-dependent dehydrogenase
LSYLLEQTQFMLATGQLVETLNHLDRVIELLTHEGQLLLAPEHEGYKSQGQPVY